MRRPWPGCLGPADRGAPCHPPITQNAAARMIPRATRMVNTGTSQVGRIPAPTGPARGRSGEWCPNFSQPEPDPLRVWRPVLRPPDAGRPIAAGASMGLARAAGGRLASGVRPAEVRLPAVDQDTKPPSITPRANCSASAAGPDRAGQERGGSGRARTEAVRSQSHQRRGRRRRLDCLEHYSEKPQTFRTRSCFGFTEFGARWGDDEIAVRSS